MKFSNKRIWAGLAVMALLLGLAYAKREKLSNSFERRWYRVLDFLDEKGYFSEEIATAYPKTEKFWLHRANSIEKINEKGTRYEGVELDLVFYPDENRFDVSHDYLGKVDYPLETFLPIIAKSKHKVWFDYKNLTAENAAASAGELERLLAVNGISKSAVLVESRNYAELSHFKAKGFYTSFYVPTHKKYLKAENAAEFRGIVKQAAASGNVDAVSFPIAFYDVVVSSQVGTDYLTWNNGHKWFANYTHARFRKVFEDDRVKVVLVKDLGHYNR